MKKKDKMLVVPNYRTFDENDGFMTDQKCDQCGDSAEQYIAFKDNFLVCKKCLSNAIDILDETFLEYCVTSARK